jgi:hypothetical protein
MIFTGDFFWERNKKNSLNSQWKNLKTLIYHYEINSIVQFPLISIWYTFLNRKEFWIVVILLILSQKLRISNFQMWLWETFLRKSPVYLPHYWVLGKQTKNLKLLPNIVFYNINALNNLRFWIFLEMLGTINIAEETFLAEI